MRVAVEGCSHGCLDQIYASVLELDRKDGKRTDLLLLCGDVQTLRNASDLHCLAVPDKYKQMGDFHRYYSGDRVAPILTIMIGGNHEASNYLWELFYGGWVAPNIYYLGAAGCVDVAGLTICGISGIYKSHDYRLGRHEQMPYNAGTVRSIYHTRTYDVNRLSLLAQLSVKPSIIMSHDWPNTIEQHGDVSWLTWKKPFFKQEIDTQTLGSPPLMTLLRNLQPAYWFAAHLHVRFAALVKHDGSRTQTSKAKKDTTTDGKALQESGDSIQVENTEVMNISMDSDEDEPAAGASNGSESKSSASGSTRFLALSKCLAGQDFLQVLDVEGAQCTAQGDETQEVQISFNVTWLAILKTMEPFLSLEKQQVQIPDSDDLEHQKLLLSNLEWVKSNIEQQGRMDIRKTQTFVPTAAPMAPGADNQIFHPPSWYTNPQTVALCSLLDISNRINPPPRFDQHLNQSVISPPHRAEAAEEEAEEIRRIEAAAGLAMQRRIDTSLPLAEDVAHSEEINVTLSDDEDLLSGRWKEGTG